MNIHAQVHTWRYRCNQIYTGTHINTQHMYIHTETDTHITLIYKHMSTQRHIRNTHRDTHTNPCTVGSLSLFTGDEKEAAGPPTALPEDSRVLVAAAAGGQHEDARTATPRANPGFMGPERSTTGEEAISAPCSSPSCKHLEDIPEITLTEKEREWLIRRPGGRL